MVSDNLNNSGNISNRKLGRDFVLEGKFNDADRCFEAELTHSDSPNTLVFDDHGHLLNMLGQYEDAIDKFDSLLNSFPDYVSSLFGKGISYIGLNHLDEALYYFKKVVGKDSKHANAWYYSAIIYGNPFYHGYDFNLAKEYYGNYLNSRDDYIKNHDYSSKSYDDLSLEGVNKYQFSRLFFMIAQILERNSIDEFDNFLKYYKKLPYFDDEELDKQFDIFRLFDDEESLSEKIEEFNQIKYIEDKFESAGYKKELIDDLSTQFGGLSIDNKKNLIELMDYFKTSQLSFNEINELIRKNVLDEISLNLLNKDKESIVNNLIKENTYQIERNVEKKVNREWDKKIEKKVNDLNKQIEENEQLKKDNEELVNEKESLIKENKKLNQNPKNLRKGINQKNSSFDKYVELMKEIEDLMDSYYSDNELFNKMVLRLKDDYKDASSKNILSGINHEDYKEDLKDLKERYNISEEVLNTFELAFQKFNEGNFEDAINLFEELSKTFRKDKLLNKYRMFLKATSLSRKGDLKGAYQLIEVKINKYKKLSKQNKKEKEKYPIGWFNFGNICLDYANSQSIEDFKNAKKAYKLAYFCYDCVKEFLSNQEENPEYEFYFKDENTEEDFKNNFKRMFYSKNVYKNLEDFEKIQRKITSGLSDLKKLQKMIILDFSDNTSVQKKEI